MGVAQSKNVASAVSNVANYVQNSTSGVTNTTSINVSKVDISKCFIQLENDFNVKTASNIVQQSNQIISALQNSTVKNDIQQKMLQEATSKVGTLGVGYASATNQSSMLCNVTNNIIQAMSGSINQFASTSNTFTCDDSTIIAKNLNISFSNSANFLSEQTLNNTQITDITNQITQESSQKASATVQGMTGLIIALAILIGAIGYAISKPLASGSKTIIVPCVGIAFIIIPVWLYMVQAPPFFNDNTYLSVNNPKWGGGKCGSENIIKVQERSLPLTEPPMKYNFPILPDENEQKGDLLSMYISKKGLGAKKDKYDTLTNGGYNYANAKTLQYEIKGKFYSSLDKDNKLYEQVFNGFNAPEQYQLPPPLIAVCNGQTYAVIPPVFADGCSGTLVQFNDGFDANTGQILKSLRDDNDRTVCPNFPEKTNSFNQLCCNTNNFYFEKWTSSTTDSTKYSWTGNINSKNIPAANIICNLNISSIRDYFNTGSPELMKRKALYARYLFCRELEIPNLDVYVDDWEPVQYNERGSNIPKIGIASDLKDNCYYFTDYGNWEYKSSIKGGGTIRGQFGICNNQSYKVQNFCKKILGYIIIAIILIFFAYIFLRKPPLKKNVQEKKKKDNK